MLSYYMNHDLEGYQHSFGPNFFNSLGFQKNQKYDPLYSFYAISENEKTIPGMIHFTRVGDSAVSQPKGPFGGFELDPVVTEDDFAGFNAFIEAKLREEGIKRIELIERPDVLFNPVSFDLIEALNQMQFRVQHTDIGHYINLDDMDGISLLHPMERRNFRKALAKNYRWKLESLDALPEVYSFIERCRAQQKLLVNITFDDLRRSFENFPGKYRIFSIRHKDYLTAVSITVEENSDVLYNYLPASDQRFKQDSPMVFLMVSLYKYAKSLGYQVLDLGVSSVNGKLQTGLAEFKERMGGLLCEKKTLEKVLD